MAPTKNAKLLAWVDEVAALTTPDRSSGATARPTSTTGSARRLVDAGTFTRLADAKRPNSYWSHSDPGDVARVEDRTFICSENEIDAGPTNNWRDPAEMRADARRPLQGLHEGPHHVRRAVLHGPARLGHRPHRRAADRLGLRRGLHAHHDPHGHGRPGGARRRRVRPVPALGRRAARAGRGTTCAWPCNAENKYIVHFPETREIWLVRLGLRRQRAARQEVLRAAHRLGHGARRGLDGRAHAHPQAHLARG